MASVGATCPRALRKQGQRALNELLALVADSAADVIVDGPNDLVIETASMTQLGAFTVPKGNRLDLTGAQSVHHCSYFRDARTVDFLTKVLGI
jgi:hypothetical protein